jgi:hypothetical protein
MHTELDCEEDNIFDFFTGGMTTHEISTKDEGSESTLRNFAALLNGEVPVESYTADSASLRWRYKDRIWRNVYSRQVLLDRWTK